MKRLSTRSTNPPSACSRAPNFRTSETRLRIAEPQRLWRPARLDPASGLQFHDDGPFLDLLTAFPIPSSRSTHFMLDRSSPSSNRSIAEECRSAETGG